LEGFRVRAQAPPPPDGGMNGPPPPDGSQPPPDGSQPPPDGGMSGPPPDSGMSGSDSGMSGSDSGMSGSDSGMSGPDSGMSGPDSGMSGSDSGNSGPEGGMSGSDSGMSGPGGEDSGVGDITDMFSCPYVVMITFSVVDGPDTRFNGSFTLYNDTVSHTGILMGNYPTDDHHMGGDGSGPAMMEDDVDFNNTSSGPQKVGDGEVVLDINTAILFTCARSYSLDLTISGQDDFSVVVNFDFYDLSSIRDVENFSPNDSGYGYVNGSGTYSMSFSVNDDGTVSGMPRDGVFNTAADAGTGSGGSQVSSGTAAFSGTTAAIAISSVVFVGIVFAVAYFIWRSRNAVKPITVGGTTLGGEKQEAAPGIQQHAGEVEVNIPPASTS